MATTPDPTAA
jgi:hypothetical protein